MSENTHVVQFYSEQRLDRFLSESPAISLQAQGPELAAVVLIGERGDGDFKNQPVFSLLADERLQHDCGKASPGFELFVHSESCRFASLNAYDNYAPSAQLHADGNTDSLSDAHREPDADADADASRLARERGCSAFVHTRFGNLQLPANREHL